MINLLKLNVQLTDLITNKFEAKRSQQAMWPCVVAIAKIEQSGLHDNTLFDGYKSFDIISGTK